MANIEECIGKHVKINKRRKKEEEQENTYNALKDSGIDVIECIL